MDTPDDQRARLRVEDPLLPRAVYSSRGLYGTIGDAVAFALAPWAQPLLWGRERAA